MSRSLILYFTSEIFLSFGLGIIQYAQPFFFTSAGIDDKVVGMLFSIGSLTGGIAALFLGSLADRIGATHVFKFSTLMLGLGYLMMALTTHVSVWALTSAFTGLGGALLMSTENVVLSALTAGQEKAGILSKFVAWYMFLMGSGQVVSGFLSPVLGFQKTMLVGSCVALCAPILRVFVKAKQARAHTLFRMPSKRMMAMSIYALLFGVAMGLLSPFVTLIMKNFFHLSTHTTAIVSALSVFTVSLGSLMVSSLLRIFKRGTTLFLSYFCSVALTFILALTGNAWGFVTLYLGRSTVASIPGSIVDATFLNLTHATGFAQMFGVRVFGTNVGSAIGSYVGGGLLNRHALRGLLWLSGVIFIAAYIYLFALLRKIKPASDPIVHLGDASGSDGSSLSV